MELTLILIAVLLAVATLDALVHHFAAGPAGVVCAGGRRSAGAVPRWVYHARNLLVAPPLVVAAVCVSYETENEWLTWSVGLGAIIAGTALRVWAQQHIRFRLRVGRRLTTTGPYAIVRNPLYIANTLICLGATVLSELLWLTPITLVWCAVVYSLVVRQEERRLEGQYGEPYRRYKQAVPRWLPRRVARLPDLGLAREYLLSSLLVELPCLIIVLPFAAKELLAP